MSPMDSPISAGTISQTPAGLDERFLQKDALCRLDQRRLRTHPESPTDDALRVQDIRDDRKATPKVKRSPSKNLACLRRALVPRLVHFDGGHVLPPDGRVHQMRKPGNPCSAAVAFQRARLPVAERSIFGNPDVSCLSCNVTRSTVEPAVKY